VIEPLRISFEVDCSPEHAFGVWTTRIDTWWPRDHTVSGDAALVVLENRVGGRIYERAIDGVEHQWGEVTVWDPPKELTYMWHLGSDPVTATEVEIRFHAEGIAATRIEIEHRGWERLGDGAAEWRARNHAGWDALLPHFETELVKGAR
jgi:Activator of Hsp90 ATPase homolog 1-like protein